MVNLIIGKKEIGTASLVGIIILPVARIVASAKPQEHLQVSLGALQVTAVAEDSVPEGLPVEGQMSAMPGRKDNVLAVPRVDSRMMGLVALPQVVPQVEEGILVVVELLTGKKGTGLVLIVVNTISGHE